MRKTKQTAAFKKDLKRESRGEHRRVLQEEFVGVVNQLALDRKLPPKYNDHELTGDWIGHRECHVKPDLLLVYLKTDDDTLHLVRLGSHSELF